jgi:hypothetical protein
MRRLVIVLIVGALGGLGACGGNPLDLDPDKGDRTATTRVETDRGTTAAGAGKSQNSAQGTSEAEAKPARRRLIYLDARTLCGQFGVRQVVRRFGLEPGSAAEVARAYAELNYSGPFRGSGRRGCLAGFRK